MTRSDSRRSDPRRFTLPLRSIVRRAGGQLRRQGLLYETDFFRASRKEGRRNDVHPYEGTLMLVKISLGYASAHVTQRGLNGEACLVIPSNPNPRHLRFKRLPRGLFRWSDHAKF